MHEIYPVYRPARNRRGRAADFAMTPNRCLLFPARWEIWTTAGEEEVSPFISRLTPGIFYLLNFEARQLSPTSLETRTITKLEAVILFTGLQNYDGRKVNARRARKQRKRRKGKCREEMKESSGCARTKVLLGLTRTTSCRSRKDRTFRHFITRLTSSFLPINFCGQRGRLDEETKESLHPA